MDRHWTEIGQASDIHWTEPRFLSIYCLTTVQYLSRLCLQAPCQFFSRSSGVQNLDKLCTHLSITCPFPVHSLSIPCPGFGRWTVPGQTLYFWTLVGQGLYLLDSDWTEAVLGQGLDSHWTEIGQGLDFCPVTVQPTILQEHRKTH